MSTSEIFEMGAPAAADQVGDALTRTAAAQNMASTGGVRFERPGTGLRTGLFVSSSASTPPPFLSPVEEVFGFLPAAQVVFSPYNADGADAIAQRRDMIRLVVAVLDAVPGDALLAFEREITRLVRIAGKLTISMEDGFWVPEVTALLPPHDRGSLPNL